MSDNDRRIIDYDAFNDLPPNSWLIVDSEGQGTGKIAPIKIGATYEIQDGAHSFTLVGSNGYTHTVDIPYDSVQMSYADYQALTEVQKMDGTNRFVPDVPTDDLEPEIWQRVGRTPLTTVEKTISLAINELKGRIDDSDTEIEDIKSNLTELEYDSGWVQGSVSGVNCKRRKVGKMVTIYFHAFSVSAVRTWHKITDLPSDWLPAYDISAPIAGGDHRQYSAMSKVDATNGDYRIYSNTSADGFEGTITYPVG